MYRMLLITVALAAIAVAQTQVDLRTQSKSVDFSGASSTKPLTTGTSLPATCAIGQMYFVSNAPAGQNVYGCTATNAWTLQSGGSGGGGSGTVSIQSAGTAVGASSTLNFSGGSGILYAISNAGPAISIQTSVNTAVAQTLASDQTDAVRWCVSSSGSAASYTCALAPTLTAYTVGMVLNWTPDVTAPGGPVTLNTDFLGAIPLKLADGLTDPGPGDIVGGRMQQIWYDGSHFRLLNEVIPSGVLGDVLPTCSVAARGRLWFVAGASGAKDSLTICAKDATDAYSWRTLF